MYREGETGGTEGRAFIILSTLESHTINHLENDKILIEFQSATSMAVPQDTQLHVAHEAFTTLSSSCMSISATVLCTFFLQINCHIGLKLLVSQCIYQCEFLAGILYFT